MEYFSGVFCPLIDLFFRGRAFFQSVFQNGGASPSILEKAPLVNESFGRSRAQGPLTAKPFNFGEGPSILEKWRYPKKKGQFWGGKNILCIPQNIFLLGNRCAMCFLQKKIDKNPSNLALATAQTFYCRVQGPGVTTLCPVSASYQQRDRVQQCTRQVCKYS